MTKIDLDNVGLGDTLILSNGERIIVEDMACEPDDILPYWINDRWFTRDGYSDVTDPKAPRIVAITINEEEAEAEEKQADLSALLSAEGLPEELDWVKKTITRKKGKRGTKYQKLLDLMKEHKRDFAISELAVLHYRLTGKISSRSQLLAFMGLAVKEGVVKRTGRGRYKAA